MPQGGIYRPCEEAEDTVNKEVMIPKRAGGFLLQHCRCGSEGTSMSILYIVNGVSFLLWIIIFAVMLSKYSEMAKELEQLRSNQTALRTNGFNMEKQLQAFNSKHSAYGSSLNGSLHKLEADHNTLKKDAYKELHDLQKNVGNFREEAFKIQGALYKINASACRICPEGWVLNRGQCYFFQKMSQHWSFAKNRCEEKGARLVSINDAEEQKFLTSIVKKEWKDYWIGLNDIHAENTFVWVGGDTVSYTNWYVREPNNLNKGEDCVVMKSSGFWNDQECGGTADGWICEKSWSC
ncbi:low affinity immunoglobulin epsilon Fc receptor-like [Elgaria multicarinata webbii]|uniref:low affinity immunoglobulin epsilon Fc receptor-like n=1 Tax=Elgaria multicarinata webbii TaxID=159646 RepID=UPI002FCCDBF2